MTTLWQDSIIAMLAAVGLMALLWLLVSALSLPWRKRCPGDCIALLPSRGDGEGLEAAVRELLRKNGEAPLFCSLMILDQGLNQEGRKLALLLCRSDDSITLCKQEDLLQRLSQKKDE